jgi:hypothetical protein
MLGIVVSDQAYQQRFSYPARSPLASGVDDIALMPGGKDPGTVAGFESARARDRVAWYSVECAAFPVFHHKFFILASREDFLILIDPIPIRICYAWFTVPAAA